jgi:hypothetical protein
MNGSTPPHMYDAFGERKTLAEWASDSRCPLDLAGLQQRVERGGMTVEEAFAAPVRGSQHAVFEAFGERKVLREWSQDPRCPVKLDSLTTRVTFCKMTVEQAFALGSQRTGRTRGRKRKNKRRRTPAAWTLTAWGETKTLKEWAKDPRANAAYPALLNRLKQGFSPEQVITLQWHPPGPAKDAERSKSVTAWGQTKSAAEWAADPRANVLEVTIRRRLARCWPPELAISVRWWRDLTLDQQRKIVAARNGIPSRRLTEREKRAAR